MITADHPAVAAVVAAQAERTRLTLAQSNLEGRLTEAKEMAEQAAEAADNAGAEALLAGEGTGTVTGKAILALRQKAADAAAQVREIETALRLLPDKLRAVDIRTMDVAPEFDAALANAVHDCTTAAVTEFVDGFLSGCLPASAQACMRSRERPARAG